MPTATPADSFELAMAPPAGKRDLTGVFAELNEARSSPTFMQAFNAGLKDERNPIKELEGFELTGFDKEGDMHFSSRSGVRRQYKADGTRVEQWGAEKNDREFVINKDGTATHEIRPGECVWNIAKDIVRERKGDKPTNAEIAAEVERIRKANPQIKDIDVIKEGKPLTIPKESVDSLTKERKLRNVSTVKEEMLKEGGIFDKVDSNPKDGAISKEEIKQYKEKNPSMTDEERKALDIVEEKFDRISKRAAIQRGETIPPKASISKEDIEIWADYKIAKINSKEDKEGKEEEEEEEEREEVDERENIA